MGDWVIQTITLMEATIYHITADLFPQQIFFFGGGTTALCTVAKRFAMEKLKHAFLIGQVWVGPSPFLPACFCFGSYGMQLGYIILLSIHKERLHLVLCQREC